MDDDYGYDADFGGLPDMDTLRDLFHTRPPPPDDGGLLDQLMDDFGGSPHSSQDEEANFAMHCPFEHLLENHRFTPLLPLEVSASQEEPLRRVRILFCDIRDMALPMAFLHHPVFSRWHTSWDLPHGPDPPIDYSLVVLQYKGSEIGYAHLVEPGAQHGSGEISVNLFAAQLHEHIDLPQEHFELLELLVHYASIHAHPSDIPVPPSEKRYIRSVIISTSHVWQYGTGACFWPYPRGGPNVQSFEEANRHDERDCLYLWMRQGGTEDRALECGLLGDHVAELPLWGMQIPRIRSVSVYGETVNTRQSQHIIT
ncbi:hypothetical protein CALCODRAFT_513644, partial [Calocera cornea HHB12733]